MLKMRCCRRRDGALSTFVRRRNGMATFGWSYKKDARPDLSKPAAAPLVQADKDQEAQLKKQIHRINDGDGDEDAPRKRIRRNPAARIFVGSIPITVDENALFDFWKVFGEVTETVVIRDEETNISKGFGFVQFATEGQAQKARQWAVNNAATMAGKRIHVDLANQKRSPQEFSDFMDNRERDRRQRTKADVRSLLWEYKWDNNPKSEIHGSFSSKQMQAWKEQGFFKNGGVARQLGTSVYKTEFEAIEDIEFDLFP
eukprot:m.121402 g.121402  ORF g.121402 m.121402 type:complete len:257 (+) comp9606_c0_seq2:1370-2140(+)